MDDITFPSTNQTQSLVKVVEINHILYSKFIRQRNRNPILNLHEYVVQYPYRIWYTLTYAKVFEHLYSQIDEAMNCLCIYSVIVGHHNSKGDVENTKNFMMGMAGSIDAFQILEVSLWTWGPNLANIGNFAVPLSTDVLFKTNIKLVPYTSSEKYDVHRLCYI